MRTMCQKSVVLTIVSDIPHEKAAAQDIEKVGVENSRNLDIVM